MSHESDNLVERDLPLHISRAITRTMTWRDGEFARLVGSERSMLVEVLRCVSKSSPDKAAFIRRETLTARLDCSLATVGRLLARLQELGWILRDQVKSRIRGFQVGSIALTPAAVSWLGLDCPVPASRRSTVSDACSLSDQSLRRQPPQAGGTPEIASPSAEQSGNGPTSSVVAEGEAISRSAEHSGDRLPVSLRWMLEKMSAWGVFKLMGLARKRGLLLETVTQQCEAQIRASKDGFAYVRGLLGLDKDWSFIAEQERSSCEAVAQQAATKDRLAQAVGELEGRAFIGPDGDVRKVYGGWISVYGQEEARKLLGSAKGAQPMSLAILDEIQSGVLRAWSPDVQHVASTRQDKGGPPLSSVNSSGLTATHAGSVLLEALKSLRPVAVSQAI